MKLIHNKELICQCTGKNIIWKNGKSHGETFKHGVKHKDSFPKAIARDIILPSKAKGLQATAQFRNAYHAPYKVLKRLREGITCEKY